MNRIECVAAENPFWRGLKPEHIERIATGAREKSFDAGSVIFREDEPANQIYLIQSGKIALESRDSKGNVVEFETLGVGDVIGWGWLFPPFRWHSTALALEPTKALVCDGAALLVESEEDEAFGHQLMKRIAQLVIHRLEATRNRLKDLQSTADASEFEVKAKQTRNHNGERNNNGNALRKHGTFQSRARSRVGGFEILG